jgi:hypothetical protein
MEVTSVLLCCVVCSAVLYLLNSNADCWQEISVAVYIAHICTWCVQKVRWMVPENKQNGRYKLTLLAFKIIAILHNTLLATFIKLLETVSKCLFRNRSQNRCHTFWDCRHVAGMFYVGLVVRICFDSFWKFGCICWCLNGTDIWCVLPVVMNTLSSWGEIPCKILSKSYASCEKYWKKLIYAPAQKVRWAAPSCTKFTVTLCAYMEIVRTEMHLCSVRVEDPFTLFVSSYYFRRGVGGVKLWTSRCL